MSEGYGKGTGLKAHAFKTGRSDTLNEELNRFFVAHGNVTVLDIKMAATYDGKDETCFVVVLYRTNG